MFLSKNLLKSLFLILLLAAPFAAQQNGSSATNPQSQAAAVTEFEVNGLKVLVKRRANSPTVAVGLFLRGGSKNLTPENAGIENFALETATESSVKFPRVALRRELAKTGSVINSGTNFDFSALSMATTRANFDRSWDIFTDVALNPSFAPEDVARVKDRILTGLREQTSSPDSYLEILGRQAAFAGHPYANSPEGTIENVLRFKPEDLRRYYQSMMQTSRLLLVVVGDIEAAQVKPKVEAAFGKLPRGNYQDKSVPTLSFSTPTIEVTARQLPTNYIQGTYAAPSPADPDIYAMRVATAILRDRVFEEVRVKRNLSYAPGASLDNRAANTAGIYVSAVDANRSIGVMLDEIKKLQENLVDESDMIGVKGQYLTTYYLGQETNLAQTADLATSELIGGGWRNSLVFLDKIRAVTPEDVRRVSRKYMRNIRFVVLGNPADINRQIFTRQSAEPLTFTQSR
jgi:predicted Zn-dependent peptidase